MPKLQSHLLWLIIVGALSLAFISSAATPSLEVYDDFESPTLGNQWEASRFKAGAVSIQTNISHSGNSAVMITLQPKDTFEAGINGSKDSERDELLEAKKFVSAEDRNYEYGFSMFLPTNFPIVPTRLVLAQWKQACPNGANCSDDSPVFALRYVAGKLHITHQIGEHQSDLFSTTNEFRGHWNDLKFQIRFTTNQTGRIRAWLNGTLVVDFNCQTAYAECTSTGYPHPGHFYFKMGLYRDLMPEPMTLYIDDYHKLQLPDDALATEILPEVADLPIRKEMPDVLTMNNGDKVTTAAQWSQRREEMKQIIQHYELGHAPPPPGNVTGTDVSSTNVLDGAANFRQVRLKFGPAQKLGIAIAIYTPTGAGPFPTIINPSFFQTPGTATTNTPAAMASTQSTNASSRPRLFNFNAPVTPERGAQNFSNILSRGYAIVTYRYTQCGEDNTNFLNSTFFPAYPGYDWGVLYSWAWGLSRIVDYLETQPFVDKSKLIALGHSRLGKLTMIATALDDRISLGAPAGSSGAGTGAYRFCGPGRGGKEGFEDMTRKFSWYFVPRAKEFTGQMEKLPFDAHWFIALTAPRPWISVEGTDDQNCVPNAVKQSILAAKPVYEFLEVSPDRIGVNYESHRHGLTPEDWTAALDFADQQLRGIDHHRTFDHYPFEATPTNSATSSPITNKVELPK